MDIRNLLAQVADNDASNLLLLPGAPPLLSIDGSVYPLEMDPLPTQELDRVIGSTLESGLDLNDYFQGLVFSRDFDNLGRFRVSIFPQNGAHAAVIRRLPSFIPQFNDLGLPAKEICQLMHSTSGLVVVSGQSESGRSTTISAMLNYINETFPYHVVTMEGPTEFIFQNHRSFFDQRDIYGETDLLRELGALDQQDVHVVMLQADITSDILEAIIHTAEMGRLVLVHFPSPDIVQTLQGIIFSVSQEKRDFFLNRLALVLKAVISQRLLPRVSGRGRSLAYEFLINTHEAASYISDMKLQQLATLMESNSSLGMQTLEMSLTHLYTDGEITEQVAMREARRTHVLKAALRELK